MLYENYQKKLKRIATAISLVVKTLPIIFIAIAVLAVIALSLVVAKGSVGSVNCPDELIYGEQIECKAFGLLTSVTYEYCGVGTDEWTTEVPTLQGEYLVRAVGTTSFGTKRYSDSKTITILPKEIEVFVAEDMIMYGEMPTPSANILAGESISCESFTYSDITAARTDIVPDKEKIKIYNADGDDITDCYTITVVAKTTDIVPRPVSITVEDYSAIYNGKECSFNKFEISEGSLKDGDTLSGSFESITDVGSIDNEPSFKVLNADGNDVTHLYALDVQSGKLTVDKRPLILTTQGFDSTYNGAEQYLSEYVVDGETSVAEGHKIITVSYGKYTNAGDYTNAMAFKIVDENEKDVSDNYAITVVEGAVNIAKRPVTVTTPSEKWVYDGNMHYSYKDVVGDGLAEGHKVVSSLFFPTITDAGTVENKYIVAILDDNLDEIPDIGWDNDIAIEPAYEPAFDYNGEFIDLSNNYEITYVYGTLEVTKREITIKPEDVKEVYDGKELAPAAVVFAESSANELVGGHILTATMTGSRLNVGSEVSEVVLESVVITRETYAEGEEAINVSRINVTDNYEIKTEKGSIEVTVRDLVLKTKSETWMYDGKAHHAAELEDGFVPDLAEGDVLEILSVPTVTNVIEGEIENEFTSVSITTVNANGETESRYDNYNITYDSGTISVYPRTITVTAESHEAVYSGKKIYFQGFTVSGDGLAEGQVLTVLDSTEFEDAMDAPGINEILDFSIHFEDDPPENDVKEHNYEWTLAAGYCQVGKRFITVTAEGHEWTYDGQAHFWLSDEYGNSTVEVDNLADDHYFKVDSFVSVTDYQDIPAENRVVIKVYVDVDDVPVDKTYNYQVAESSTYGKLIINKRPITIITEGQTWVYDGYEHWLINSDETPNAVSVNNRVEGHEYQITWHPSVLGYTESPVENRVEVFIYEMVDGNMVDKMHNYFVSDDSVYGDLCVDKRVIKVRTEEALSAIYNSEIQEFRGFEVLSDYGDQSIAPNQIFEVLDTTDFENVMFDPESGEVISAYNEILSFIIYYEYDGEKNDVSENYIVEWDKREVKINLFEVNVTTFDNKWVYDGLTHSCENDEYDRFGVPLMDIGLLAGIEWYVIDECAEVMNYTEVAIKNTLKLKIFKYDANGDEVETTSNYKFIESFGTLTVDKRAINITTESNFDTVYDGDSHTFTNPEMIVIVSLDGFETGLVQGHEFTVLKSTSLKYATEPECDNVYESYKIICTDGEPVTDNYSISFTLGRIKLKQRTVILKTGSSVDHVYDATPVSCTDWTYSDYSEYDFVDTFKVVSSTTKINVNRATADDPVGWYDNIFDQYTITDDGDVDRSGNYIVLFDEDCGIILINPRPITVTSLGATKEYDSDPLTMHDFKLTAGNLVSDHKITNTYSESITRVGEQDNLFETVIAGAEGDVTYNYEVTREWGVLEVTPVPVRLAILEVKALYDGKTYNVNLSGGLQTGRSDIKVSNVKLDLGISTPGVITVEKVEGSIDEISCTVRKTLADGRVITVPYDCYEIVEFIKFGENAVEVTKRSITIQAKDADKVFDPNDETPLTMHDYYLSGDGLLSDHQLTVYYDGSIVGNASTITVGVNKILCDKVTIVDGNNESVKEYYDITYVDGTLKVFPTEESQEMGS